MTLGAVCDIAAVMFRPRILGQQGRLGTRERHPSACVSCERVAPVQFLGMLPLPSTPGLTWAGIAQQVMHGLTGCGFCAGRCPPPRAEGG